MRKSIIDIMNNAIIMEYALPNEKGIDRSAYTSNGFLTNRRETGKSAQFAQQRALYVKWRIMLYYSGFVMLSTALECA